MGSEESPPESEQQVFVLGSFYTIQTSGSCFSHASNLAPTSLSRQCSYLRSWVNKITKMKLKSNAWSKASRAASKDIRHSVAIRRQEGWYGASRAAVRHIAALTISLVKTLTSII